MNREDYKKQATELGDILLDTFEKNKYRDVYNLWSLTFLWDGSKIGEYSVTNPYRLFMPATFELIPQNEISKPKLLIPKSISFIGHYSMLSLTNRSLIERTYTEALEENDYKKIEEVFDIASDKKLINEALEKFVYLKEKNLIDEKADLFDFILRYNLELDKMEKSRKPSGSLVNLAVRLAYRHGEDNIENEILSYVSAELASKVKTYHSLLNKKEEIPKETIDLHQKYLNDNGSIIEKPERATKVKIEGPRKVKVNGNTASINWAAFLEERKRRIVSYQAFNPTEIIAARVERTLTESFLNFYKVHNENTDEVLAAIDIHIEKASDAEKEILKRVREKFEIIGRFQNFNIKHKMPVTIRRK